MILARLAFGAWLAPAERADDAADARAASGRPGITGVTALEDRGRRRRSGLTLKLLASRASRGRRASVARRSSRRAVDREQRPRANRRGPQPDRDRGGAGRDRRLLRARAPAARRPASAVLGDLIALARGHGSTWAGLAPADAAPRARRTPADPFARGPAWFAFLPGVAPTAWRCGETAADRGRSTAATAVRTGPLPLGAASASRSRRTSPARRRRDALPGRSTDAGRRSRLARRRSAPGRACSTATRAFLPADRRHAAPLARRGRHAARPRRARSARPGGSRTCTSSSRAPTRPARSRTGAW